MANKDEKWLYFVIGWGGGLATGLIMGIAVLG